MELRKLGGEGLEISVVGYGAWEAGGEGWGEAAADDQLVETMLAGIDAGINWIDTAESYGNGKSEEVVGRVLRARPDVLVFTKVAPFGTGTRPQQVKRAVQGSLQRLGVDRIDLYQIHWPAEHEVPVEDTWGAMAELQDEGLVRAIGVSNFDRALIERCLAIRHVDSVQNQFSLLHRDDERDFLPWLEERGIGYLAYGPLAFGLLTGAITAETEFGEDDWRSGGDWNVSYYRELFAPGKIEASLDVVEALKEVARDADLPLATLSLRAAIETPGVTGVIAGTRRAKHVVENARAGAVRLNQQTREALERALAR